MPHRTRFGVRCKRRSGESKSGFLRGHTATGKGARKYFFSTSSYRHLSNMGRLSRGKTIIMHQPAAVADKGGVGGGDGDIVHDGGLRGDMDRPQAAGGAVSLEDQVAGLELFMYMSLI